MERYTASIEIITSIDWNVEVCPRTMTPRDRRDPIDS